MVSLEQRWNFEQAVLKNGKGVAGTEWPYWEQDFGGGGGGGGDMTGEISMKGAHPGRMELALATSLGDHE